MFECAISGQGLGFSLLSAYSGTPLIGLSGFISGYKTAGGTTQAGLSGNIIEIGFGQYWANLYDFDVSGKIISYYFTAASGAIPAEKTVITTLNISGFLYPASGVFVTATASPPASGTTFLASGQAVALLSGQSVLVYSGQLSGQPIAGLSGFIYPASGVNVTATATVTSGQVYLASGQATALLSGQSVLVYSGQLSGQPIAGLSGFIYPASGVNVNATATVTSGQVYLASGQAVSLNSGQSVLVYSGQLSGQPIAGLSGFIYPASGINVNATATVTSGQVYLASGQAVSLNSGQSVLVYSGQLSGQPITLASGLSSVSFASGSITLFSFASGVIGTSGGLPSAWGNSGAVTVGQNLDKSGYTVGTVLSGILSGQQVTLVSGQSYTASGIYAVATATVNPASISGAFVTVPTATISGTWPASGAFTVTTIQSGQVYLASGQAITVASGQLSGQPITLLSGYSYPASGVYATTTGGVTSGQVWLASGQATALLSGQSVLVYSGQLSGQPIAGLSGFIYPASGIFVDATASVNPASISGAFVTVPIATISGVEPASGAFTTTTIQSGTTYLASGQSVLVYSGQLSGQPIAGLSGYIYPASGVNVVATATVSPASISGVYANVPPATISGTNVVIPLAALSGVTIDLATLFTYNVSGLTPAVHSLLNAIRKLVCHWDTTSTSGFLTVYQEDAITVAYTQALTSQSGAAPVTALGDA